MRLERIVTNQMKKKQIKNKRREAAKYVVKNFGDVIKKLSKE